MRKASIRLNHVQFETKVENLWRFAKRLLRHNGLKTAEQGLCLEGFTLLLASYWEELVNDDFVDALNRDTQQYATEVGLSLPRNLPRDVCFGLLVGHGYLDFRSVNDILQKSRKLIVEVNNPFLHIPMASRKPIDNFFKLRNYLAHRSKKASKAYARMLAQEYQYTRTVSPENFLRARYGAQGIRRFFYFLDVFYETSIEMWENAPF